MMLVEIVTHPHKLLAFARKMRIAHGAYGRPYGHLLRLFYELSVQQRFTPREIFYQDLLDFESAEEAFHCAISKSALVALQQRLNPVAASVMTEDKALFYRYCRTCDLATPHFFAMIGRETGWTAEGALLRHDAECGRFLDSLPAGEIVIKPSLGVYGRGIQFLQHDVGGWRDESGRCLASSDILHGLRNGSQYDSFVVQERARNHPDIVRLSGTDYLQTLRINTGVSEGKGATVLGGRLKVIGGEAKIDNFDYGRSGNMMAHINVATGRIECAVRGYANGVGLETVDRHPVTGEIIPGFAIPYWREACDLARRAAARFLPLLTVGWDIAITPQGPLLIEGNAWWDPTTDRTAVRAFRAYVRDVLEPPTEQPIVPSTDGPVERAWRATR